MKDGMSSIRELRAKPFGLPLPVSRHRRTNRIGPKRIGQPWALVISPSPIVVLRLLIPALIFGKPDFHDRRRGDKVIKQIEVFGDSTPLPRS